MTNAEKFKEVFGFEPSKCKCPAEVCTNCPVNPCRNSSLVTIEWWNSEYRSEYKAERMNDYNCTDWIP